MNMLQFQSNLRAHTLAETAAHLNLSVDQVRMTEMRALNKLRNDPQIRRMAKDCGLLREKEILCSND